MRFIRQCAAPCCEETFETNYSQKLYHDPACKTRVMNHRVAERIRQQAIAEVQAQYGSATLVAPKINKVTVSEMASIAGLNPELPLGVKTQTLVNFLKAKSPLEVV
jgi:hypothetical protein